MNLNLYLGWKRYKADLDDMAFADHPFESAIIDQNLDQWINLLEGQITSYSPSRAEVINVPKKNFHLRPGAVLATNDGVIFSSLVLSEVQKIREALLWSANDCRFAYILKENQTGSKWQRPLNC